MIVVAVNAHTGELAALDRDSGVDLVDAVARAPALPAERRRVAIRQRDSRAGAARMLGTVVRKDHAARSPAPVISAPSAAAPSAAPEGRCGHARGVMPAVFEHATESA